MSKQDDVMSSTVNIGNTYLELIEDHLKSKNCPSFCFELWYVATYIASYILAVIIIIIHTYVGSTAQLKTFAMYFSMQTMDF